MSVPTRSAKIGLMKWLLSDSASGSEVHRDVHRTEANAPAVPAPSPSRTKYLEATPKTPPLSRRYNVQNNLFSGCALEISGLGVYQSANDWLETCGLRHIMGDGLDADFQPLYLPQAKDLIAARHHL